MFEFSSGPWHTFRSASASWVCVHDWRRPSVERRLSDEGNTALQKVCNWKKMRCSEGQVSVACQDGFRAGESSAQGREGLRLESPQQRGKCLVCQGDLFVLGVTFEHFRDHWFRSRLCVGQDFRRAVGSVKVEGQLAVVSLMARAILG